LHPDDRKRSMEKIDQSVKDHKDLWNEYRVLLPEGGLRWIGASGSTSYNDQGEPLRMSGICIDISERKQAEEALRESEARYRLLADNATDVIWTLDLNGTFTYVSPSIFQLRGYTQEEVMHQSMREVLSEGSVAIVEETIRQTLEEVKSGIIPAPVVTEIEQPCRDGSSVWTEVVSRLFVDETGNPAGFIGISRNITERRRAGELLRESETRFRAILDATPFPIAFVDVQDNNIQFWSRSALTLFGHTAPTTPEWYQIAYPDPDYRRDVIDRWKPYLEKSKHSGLPVNTGEYRVTCRDGSVRICELYAAFLQDNLIVTFNDITGRKQAEEALLKKAEELCAANEELTASEEELRQNMVELAGQEQALLESRQELADIIEFLPDATFVIDRWGIVIAWNRAMEEMTRINKDEMIGQGDHAYTIPFYGDRRQQLLDVIDMDDQEIKAKYQYVQRKGQTLYAEVFTPALYGGKGAYVWVTGSPLFDIHGNRIGAVESIRDITDRKRAEEALREANKKLSLLSGITRHDINNQLLVLNGFLSLLHKKVPDPTLDDFFTRIMMASDRISAMIRFTRTYECIGVNVPVWQVVRDLVDAAAKDVTPGRISLKNDLPAGEEIFADPLIIKVFYNLIDNAVRYGGKITTIRFSTKVSGDDHLIICEDDGAGIPADEKEKIFERGFGKNTGLGLFLSREILAITGITITETGEPGKGARFEMVVPKGIWRMV